MSRTGLLDWASKRLPRFLYPMERTLIAALITTLTACILSFPNWGAWASIVARAHADHISSTRLLGAAAALLALLLFAANLLHSMHKDSGHGRTYLGENLQTFEASRSWATRLLGEPLFHLAVLSLFALPLMQPALPFVVTTPPVGVIPEVSFKPHELTLALWCSCFAIVGGALILNVLGTLRSSAMGIILPESAEWRVEDAIEKRSTAAYKRLFNPSQPAGRSGSERWTRRRLNEARNLPYNEQIPYLIRTIGAPNYTILNEALVEKYDTAVNKALSASDLTVRTWRTLRRLQCEHRLNRAQRSLKQAHKVMFGRVTALLNHLRYRELTDSTTEWIVDQCLHDARIAAKMCSLASNESLGRAESDGFSAVKTALIDTRKTLLTAADRVPSLENPLRPYPMNANPAPKLEKIPAFIFQSLAELLSASNEKRRLHLPESTLIHIIDGANDTSDIKTREYAVRKVIGGVLNESVTDRLPGTIVDRDLLRRRVSNHGKFFEGYYASTGDRVDVRKIVAQSAFGSLLSHDLGDVEATRALLKLVDGWHIPAAILYSLYYAQRSLQPLSVGDLRPFREILSHGRVEKIKNDPHITEVCVDFLYSSPIDYFVTRAGLTWLLKSLRTGFSLGLCAEFLDQRERGTITDFDLRDFVLWRLVTNQVSGPYESDPRSTISSNIWSQLQHSMPEIEAILEEWRPIDRRAVIEAESTFFAVSQNLGSERGV